IARITAYGRKTSSFPRKRESRSVGTETYRVKRFLRS
ncbi:pilin, partial [Neisseria gonorrhoeae]